MSDEPWFRMRPSKFMAGCRGLNANEFKVYMSLICRIMEHGEAVEDDREILATYCEVRPSSFDKALDRLMRLKKIIRTEDGRLTNTFCEGEISWRAGYSEKQKRAGEKSAEKRQQNQSIETTNVQPTFNHKEEDKDKEKKEDPPIPPKGGLALVSSDVVSQSIRRQRRRALESKETLLGEFAEIWPYYPRRVGTGKAQEAWVKARAIATADEIKGPLGLFIRKNKSVPVERLPHLSTWLNEKRWLDNQDHARNVPMTSAEELESLGSTQTSASELQSLFPDLQPRKAIR